MAGKVTKVSAIIGVTVVAIFIYFSQWLTPKKLVIRFHPYVGEAPLILNEMQYKNSGGEGLYTVRDLQIFISNIQISNESETIYEPESYHLVRFDGETNIFEIVIDKIELNKYENLSLGIGIDPEANGTIKFAGDLDPNSRMAWNWQVGYKFLLLEGTLSNSQEQIPLVYHIGFDESYTRISFNLEKTTRFQSGVIDLKVDIEKLFKQSPPIDMAKISHVKFDPNDVAILASAFPYIITQIEH